jgi:hypothetical protein
MWKVKWAESAEQSVHSLEELDSLLDSLHAAFTTTSPRLVIVESPDGSSIAIGLGQETSVLNFVAASGDPPYLSSVGSMTQEGTISYEFMGELTEGPARNGIPVTLARKAIRQYFLTGVLPDTVTWEED